MRPIKILLFFVKFLLIAASDYSSEYDYGDDLSASLVNNYQCSYYEDPGLLHWQKIVVRNSMSRINYFMPWIDLKETKSIEECELCFVKEENIKDNTTIPIPQITIDTPQILNILGNVQKNIFIQLGLDSSAQNVKRGNSILSADSKKYNYPVYYDDVMEISKIHFGDRYNYILQFYNAMCNFIDWPNKKYDYYATSKRRGTVELFYKYQLRYDETAWNQTLVNAYDDFMFMFAYDNYNNTNCNVFYHKRYCDLIIKYRSQIETCYKIFENNYIPIENKTIQTLTTTTTKTPAIASEEPTISTTTEPVSIISEKSIDEANKKFNNNSDDDADYNDNYDEEDDDDIFSGDNEGSGSGQHSNEKNLKVSKYFTDNIGPTTSQVIITSTTENPAGIAEESTTDSVNENTTTADNYSVSVDGDVDNLNGVETTTQTTTTESSTPITWEKNKNSSAIGDANSNNSASSTTVTGDFDNVKIIATVITLFFLRWNNENKIVRFLVLITIFLFALEQHIASRILR